MIRLPFRIVRRIAGDERGLSVVELGLVAPVLALFLAGIIDLSFGLAQRFVMQQAVNETLELLLAHPLEGDADDDDVDLTYLIDHVTEAADIDEDAVTIERWLQCDAVRMDDYAATCPGGQDSARYLSLTIEKDFHGEFFVGDMMMTASGVMRIQ